MDLVSAPDGWWLVPRCSRRAPSLNLACGIVGNNRGQQRTMIGDKELVSMMDRYTHVALVFHRAHRVQPIPTLPFHLLPRIIACEVLEDLHRIDEPFAPDHSSDSGIPSGVERRGCCPVMGLSLNAGVGWRLRGSMSTRDLNSLCGWD